MITIKSLQIKNYRQYRGEHNVNLLPSKNKNFIILVGPTGSGKTNLLNAITWCLYGIESSIKRDDERELGIINDKAMTNLGKDGVETASVKIVLDVNGKYYSIERKAKGTKLAGGKKYIRPDSELTVMLQTGKDIISSGSPQFTIDGILPLPIKDFFFFDGEKLDEFFKEKGSQKVETAIFDITQISILDKTISHIGGMLKDIRKTSGAESPNLKALEEKISGLQDIIGKNRTELEKKVKMKAQTETDIKKISEELSKFSTGSVNQLEGKISTLNELIDKLDQQRTDELEESENHLISNAGFVYLNDAIASTIKTINSKIEKGIIPPNFKDTFLKERLELGKCICGTDISKGEHRKAVEKLYEETSPLSGASQFLIEGKVILNSGINRKTSSFIEERKGYAESIKKLDSELERHRKDLAGAKRELEGIDIEEVKRKVGTREKFESAYKDLIAQIATLEVYIKNSESELRDSEKDYDAELAKSKRYEVASNKIKLYEGASNLLDRVRIDIVTKMRKIIEEKTNKYFLSLMWKKDTFSRVEIDETYTISIYNTFGTECLHALSAGEREILALSFIAALRDVSGFNLPIIIDTPLGRISKEPKLNIAKLLPKYLSGIQTIILATDQEYTDEVRSALLPFVSNEYKLDYDESESRTEVKKYA